MSFQRGFVPGLGVEKRTHPPYLLGRILLVITLLVLGTQAAQAGVECDDDKASCTCSGSGIIELARTDNKPAKWFSSVSAPDLKVEGECQVRLLYGQESYFFKNVNILAGGTLLFREETAPQAGTKTDFWASSIIVENGGRLMAYGSDSGHAFGYQGGVLTIHLYGKDEAEGKPDQQNQGALCQSPQGTGPKAAPCGIPQASGTATVLARWICPA